MSETTSPEESIAVGKRSKLAPAFWGSLILVVAQGFTFYVAFQERDFVEANQITPPEVSLGIPLAYFFGAVALLGVILFFVPISKLKMAFRIMFAFLFSWGVFIVLGLSWPVLPASLISVAAGLIWLFMPRLWLHNSLMIFALVSIGSVFGFLLSPWVAMSFMLVISVYDILSVRFGYMLWLVKRLSEFETLPAFVIPKSISDWNLNLREVGFKKLLEEKAAEREFSILGGGDVGFPLLLTVSVFFVSGLGGALIVAASSLLGLISVYLIHLFLLKGKPMPALPPISFACLVGFLIVCFV
jgi:presenilin-like A22 family membrane protease